MIKKKERTECEIYSRTVGYLRPVKQWNIGKQQEFKDRVAYKVPKECETKEEKKCI